MYEVPITPKITVRRGWRTFHCDECGLQWELATRDAMSPSGDTCPECDEVNFPKSYRIDADIVCDKWGNLKEYPINILKRVNGLSNVIALTIT